MAETDNMLEQLKNSVLQVKEMCRKIYGVYGSYLIMLIKTVTAFVALSCINQYFPGRSFMLRFIVVLAISLLCSILPLNYMSLVCAVWLLLQLSALSLEATAFVAVVLLVLALLRYLTLPGAGIVLVLLPLLFVWKVPFVVPLLVGLAGSLSAFVSVGSGVVIYYLLKLVADNLAFFTTGDEASLVDRLLFLAKGILGHETMLAVVIAFCLTTLLVYFLNRAPVPYVSQIAVTVGAVFNPLLLGALLNAFERKDGPDLVAAASVIAWIVAIIFSLFYRLLDYKGTERVQYEDDEYYYYVKAVPKLGRTTPPEDRTPPQPDILQEAGRGRSRNRNTTGSLKTPKPIPDREDKNPGETEEKTHA